MYRSALVALKPCASNDAALSYSLALARRHSLKLVGIAILDYDLVAPPEAVPIGGSAFKAQRDAAFLARTRAGIAEALAEFERRCADAGVVGEPISVEDHLATEIAHCVQRFDTLIVGHHRDDDESMLHDILKHCPRPAFVVPATPDATKNSVVVAFDGSAQAARAVEAFVASGFEASSPVHVLSQNDNVELAERTAQTAVEYLRSYGFEAFAHGEASHTNAAEQIRQAIERHAARLLVMGAYGKPAIQEFFFGSVTRSILHSVNIPILLDH